MEDSATVSQDEIDAARAAYRTAELELHELAKNVWVDGPATVDGLLSIADEHGVNQAMLRILEAPERFGPLRDHIRDVTFAEASDHLEGYLERLAVLHERLDDMTAKRETALRATDPGHLQIVNVGGRPFEIDPTRGELRSLDNPAERYRLPDDAQSRDTGVAMTKPSLTEQMAKEAGIEPVQPTPPRDRTRSR